MEVKVTDWVPGVLMKTQTRLEMNDYSLHSFPGSPIFIQNAVTKQFHLVY